MPSLFVLIPIAMIFCALAVKLFFWAMDNDQFEELEKEGERIVFDDDQNDKGSE